MRTVGFPRAVVDEVGSLWAYRFIPLLSKKVVVIDNNDQIVGYAYFTNEDHHIVSATGVAVHPEHSGMGLDAALLDWAEQCARDAALRAPQDIRTVLQSTLYEAERDTIKLLEDRGYTPAREWVHLVLEMHEPPVVPTLPSHLTLRETDLDSDWDIVDPAMDEAYADHWGAIPPGSFEVGEQREVEDSRTNEDEDRLRDSSYSNALGYCFIVLDGDTVAGGILCNAKLVERADTGRVGSLFVRPRYRRQGIARTLMLAAFHAFWKNGFRRIITDTDAKSFTSAPKLYEGLGMKPYRHELTYEKEIRAGREVRLLDDNKR
jgi:GNAT superfamily N-acetyltransferase